MSAAPDERAAVAVLKRLSPLRPTLGIVLGSGFQRTIARMEVAATVPYRRIPGFPASGVGGHAGNLVLGRLGGAPVVVLAGRSHYYEGHDFTKITLPVRALAGLGVRSLLLTNAAGGINARFQPGDLMVITDHINLMGANPLRGPCPEGRERFVDLTEAYDAGLRGLLTAAAKAEGLRLRKGVYLAVSGPSYETPAEIRAFARWGADAVGMSTVPETIVARQCGLRVAGLSCITNLAAGRSRTPLSHHEVLETAVRVEQAAAGLLERFASLHAAHDHDPA